MRITAVAVVVLLALVGVTYAFLRVDASTVETPNLVDLTIGVAREQVTKMGLVTEVAYESNDRPAGTVVRTDPAAGTRVPPRSTVRLWVSTGPP